MQVFCDFFWNEIMRAMALDSSWWNFKPKNEKKKCFLEIPLGFFFWWNFTSALNYFLCIDACSRHEKRLLNECVKKKCEKEINKTFYLVFFQPMQEPLSLGKTVFDVSCTVSRQLDWYALMLFLLGNINVRKENQITIETIMH